MKFVKLFPFLKELTVHLGRLKCAYMKQLEKNIWIHYVMVEEIKALKSWTSICYLSDSLPYLDCLSFLRGKNDILSLCEDLVRSIWPIGYPPKKVLVPKSWTPQV